MAIEIKLTIGGEALEHLASAVHELAGTIKVKESVRLYMGHGEAADGVEQVADSDTAVSASGKSQDDAPSIANMVPMAQNAIVPVGQPAQNGAGQAPIQTVPTTSVTQEYTMEQIGVAMTGLMERVGMPGIQEIMAQFGVRSLMEIPKEAYSQLVEVIRQKGGQI